MTYVLSPQATAFTPSFEPVNLAIFNDGVPAMSFQPGHESELLHGIPDDAIDEAFPPTAEEAAELEAAEYFVSLMANLAFLEEREEATRSVHAGLKKRWEARRELVGRPRLPKHLVHSVPHGEPRLADSNSLVVHDHAHEVLENRMRAKESSRMAKPRVTKKVAKGPVQKPIQQPRKHY